MAGAIGKNSVFASLLALGKTLDAAPEGVSREGRQSSDGVNRREREIVGMGSFLVV